MRLTEEQKQLAEDNHNLIYGFLSRRRLNDEDYYDICAIGLCKAAATYDPTLGHKFSTYAYSIMDNEVKNFWRESNSVVRKPALPLMSIYDVAQGKNVRGDPTIEEMLVGRGDAGASPFGPVYVGMFVDSLPERERQVIKMRLNGLSLEEIGDEIGRSYQCAFKLLGRVREKYINEMTM